MGRLVIRRECRDGRRAVRLVLPDRRVITVTLEDTGRNYARLAIEAPADVVVLREELEAAPDRQPPPAIVCAACRGSGQQVLSDGGCTGICKRCDGLGKEPPASGQGREGVAT